MSANSLPGFMNKRFALVLLNALMFAVILLAGIGLDVNDDFNMHLLANGYYGGEHIPYIPFLNVIYGMLLKALYSITGAIDWYFFLLIVIQFVASSVLIVRFAHLPRWLSVITIIVFMLFVERYFLSNLQFTTTSFLAGFAAFYTLFDKVRLGEKIGWKQGAGILLLMILCFFLRNKMFLLLTGLSAPLLLMEVLSYYRFKVIKVVLFGWVAFAVLTALHMGIYKLDPAWDEYRQFNAARGQLHDNPNIDYNDNIELYNSVGWGVLEYRMFLDKYMEDEDLYNAATFKTIHTGLKKPLPPLSEYITKYLGIFRSNKATYVMLFLLQLVILWFVPAGKRWYWLLQGLLLVGGMYFIMLSATPKHRVMVPMVVFTIFMSLQLLVANRKIVWPKLMSYALPPLAGLLLLAGLYRSVQEIRVIHQRQDDFAAQLDHLDTVIPEGGIMLFWRAPEIVNHPGFYATDPYPFPVYAVDWTSQSPAQKKYADQLFGAGNGVLDCLAQGNCYLPVNDNNLDMLERVQEYMSKYHNHQIEFVQVGEVGGKVLDKLFIFKASEVAKP